MSHTYRNVDDDGYEADSKAQRAADRTFRRARRTVRTAETAEAVTYEQRG